MVYKRRFNAVTGGELLFTPLISCAVDREILYNNRRPPHSELLYATRQPTKWRPTGCLIFSRVLSYYAWLKVCTP